MHNAEKLITGKINNILSLNYPAEKIEVIIFSDGSSDETEKTAKSLSIKEVKVLSSSDHQGKNLSLNSAVKACSGEILIFSDPFNYSNVSLKFKPRDNHFEFRNIRSTHSEDTENLVLSPAIAQIIV